MAEEIKFKPRTPKIKFPFPPKKKAVSVTPERAEFGRMQRKIANSVNRHRQARLSTIIRNKVRNASFGSMQYLDEVHDSLGGESRRQLVGRSVIGMGSNREFGGALGKKVIQGGYRAGVAQRQLYETVPTFRTRKRSDVV